MIPPRQLPLCTAQETEAFKCAQARNRRHPPYNLQPPPPAVKRAAAATLRTACSCRHLAYNAARAAADGQIQFMGKLYTKATSVVSGSNGCGAEMDLEVYFRRAWTQQEFSFGKVKDACGPEGRRS